jgi:hypothetical protein
MPILLYYLSYASIIIIGKTAPFLSHGLPQKILPDCIRFFTSLDFAAVILLQIKVVSPASNPQPGGPRLCIYVPQ